MCGVQLFFLPPTSYPLFKPSAFHSYSLPLFWCLSTCIFIVAFYAILQATFSVHPLFRWSVHRPVHLSVGLSRKICFYVILNRSEIISVTPGQKTATVSFYTESSNRQICFESMSLHIGHMFNTWQRYSPDASLPGRACFILGASNAS